MHRYFNYPNGSVVDLWNMDEDSEWTMAPKRPLLSVRRVRDGKEIMGVYERAVAGDRAPIEQPRGPVMQQEA